MLHEVQIVSDVQPEGYPDVVMRPPTRRHLTSPCSSEVRVVVSLGF
jgi:hypothetical protein